MLNLHSKNKCTSLGAHSLETGALPIELRPYRYGMIIAEGERFVKARIYGILEKERRIRGGRGTNRLPVCSLMTTALVKEARKRQSSYNSGKKARTRKKIRYERFEEKRAEVTNSCIKRAIYMAETAEA